MSRPTSMLDWLLNPYGVSLDAYVILWVALLVFIPIAIVVGLVKAFGGKNRDDREP